MAENTGEKPREMFPEIEAFNTGRLKVSEIHEIYYEQSGKKDGKPVVFVHGGPGAGTTPRERRFFDPDVYRIVLFDQRGAGKSTPAAELKENTTWDLVADMEKLRTRLGIEKWVVFGGSWGSTLSLAYAETHPDRVTALIIRGIFNLRYRELKWFYEDGGACLVYPDAWESYWNHIPHAERHCMIGAFHRRLTSDDEETRKNAAEVWSKWELSTSRLHPDSELIKKADGDLWSQQFARIECHYFIHGGFFESDEQLLENVNKIRHIPGTIIQGRYDMVCPVDTAWRLHKEWPEADFHIVPDAGHSAREPGIQTLLLNATDKYKHL
ncbi:probable proline iminopeptidase [Gigantopelta aegis]|uniref:probable proline iminopeptidase n=1 Tax=Gigantopelta aegis TaxID=1735272 RepID=UPI001B887DDC|nr:probable proline iminopeptidase [Gigantopelta aegis]